LTNIVGLTSSEATTTSSSSPIQTRCSLSFRRFQARLQPLAVPSLSPAVRVYAHPTRHGRILRRHSRFLPCRATCHRRPSLERQRLPSSSSLLPRVELRCLVLHSSSPRRVTSRWRISVRSGSCSRCSYPTSTSFLIPSSVGHRRISPPLPIQAFSSRGTIPPSSFDSPNTLPSSSFAHSLVTNGDCLLWPDLNPFPASPAFERDRHKESLDSLPLIPFSFTFQGLLLS
jgi:hypothetical protein